MRLPVVGRLLGEKYCLSERLMVNIAVSSVCVRLLEAVSRERNKRKGTRFAPKRMQAEVNYSLRLMRCLAILREMKTQRGHVPFRMV